MVGPKDLLNKVPGKDPIAKLAKYTPASVFPEKLNISNLQTKLDSEIVKEEKKADDLIILKKIFFIEIGFLSIWKIPIIKKNKNMILKKIKTDRKLYWKRKLPTIKSEKIKHIKRYSKNFFLLFLIS